jgi:hypothetical protein
MRKIIPTAILVILITGFVGLTRPQKVKAQNATPVAASDYKMTVVRTFGYSLGGQIYGSFRLSVLGGEQNIQQVVFLMDGQPIGMVAQAPFQINIQTEDYPLGTHTLGAEVTSLDGTVQPVNGGTYDFISNQQQWSGVFKIVGVIFGILALVVAIGFLFTYLTTGKWVKELPLGAERSYGIQGGGVCSRCGRPFAFHWWGMNLIGSKFDRCDYCGKWGSVKRLPLDELRTAEQAEKPTELQHPSSAGKTEQEKTKELLDDSKFMD